MADPERKPEDVVVPAATGEEAEDEDAGVAEPGEEAKDPLPPAELFSIEVLPMLIENQRQHGLRHDDFLRYRQYCTRRIRRLRKALSFTQGKHRFKRAAVTLEKCLVDARYLHLALIEAERAWACAMYDRERAKNSPRAAFHMMGRLKKAVKLAAEFDKLVKECNRCDPRTQLEATAYAAWMAATHQLERDDWANAMRNFSQVKVIYERLQSIASSLAAAAAAAAVTSKSSSSASRSGEEDVSDMYSQRVKEVETNINYCAYRIQGSGGSVKEILEFKSHLDASSSAVMESLSEKLDAVLALNREQANEPVDISWRGQTVPVKSDKLRAILVRAKDKEFELSQARESDDGALKLYDEVHAAYAEASAILEEDVRATEKATATIHSQKNELLLLQLTFLSAYVTTLRLECANERFLRMIQRTKRALSGSGSTKGGKPDDLVRLYDLIIQNLTDLADLDYNRDDEGFVKATSAKILAYRAQRCFCVAESYRTSIKYGEALALYQRTMEHAVAAKALFGQLPAGSVPAGATFAEDLDALVKEVRAHKCQLHATALQAQAEQEKSEAAGGEKKEAEGARALYDALDTYVVSTDVLLAKPHFVTFPPDFSAISCKPLFFDLASNHIEFPSLKERTAQRSMVGSVLKSVTGWFGGSKS